MKCEKCEGTGEISGYDTQECGECNGAGCMACDGKGQTRTVHIMLGPEQVLYDSRLRRDRYREAAIVHTDEGRKWLDGLMPPSKEGTVIVVGGSAVSIKPKED